MGHRPYLKDILSTKGKVLKTYPRQNYIDSKFESTLGHRPKHIPVNYILESKINATLGYNIGLRNTCCSMDSKVK